MCSHSYNKASVDLEFTVYYKQIFYKQACIIVSLSADQGGAFQCTVMFLIALVELIQTGWLELLVRK